jgi:hypothetical protein
VTNYPGHYRYHTTRGLPGLDGLDPRSLAEHSITPLPASDGMRFQVDVDRPSRKAAAEHLTAKLEAVFEPEDLRLAS